MGKRRFGIWYTLKHFCYYWGLACSWNGDWFSVTVDGKTYRVTYHKNGFRKYCLHGNDGDSVCASRSSALIRYIIEKHTTFFSTKPAYQRKTLSNLKLEHISLNIAPIHHEVAVMMMARGLANSLGEAIRMLLDLGIEKLREIAPDVAVEVAGTIETTGQTITTTVRMPAGLLDVVDEAARILGASRSELIRYAVLRLLDEFMGYKRIIQDE